MRLFIASEIDPAVTKTAASVIDELRTRAARRAPRARITWVAAERAHITVRFIGEVDDAKAGAIAAAMEPPLATRVFELTVGGVGAFPRQGPPRVLWAGLTDGLGALIAVEQEVTARLTACSVPPEDRPYRPHITLARIREAAGLRSRALLDGLTDRAFGTTRVDTITLFQSQLSPKGSTYVSLQRTPLRAA